MCGRLSRSMFARSESVLRAPQHRLQASPAELARPSSLPLSKLTGPPGAHKSAR